jgi:hypothetical protein
MRSKREQLGEAIIGKTTKKSEPAASIPFHRWRRLSLLLYQLSTLYSNPGITLVCYQSVSGIYLQIHCTEIPECCIKIPDEVPAEVCLGYKYKDDTILFPCSSFGPGFEYRQARSIPGFKCR